MIFWGVVSSLAAISYKFYTKKKRIRFDVEVRRLIARPVIGIIMGAVTYLAFTSGLVLLGANGDSTSAVVGRLEVYWIIAFLAGFSDKFYLRIINLLVDRTMGDESDNGQENNDDGQTNTVAESVASIATV